ncbi:MAG TPA: YegS/Rv2252/BmrU family lipid kinase [Candidatus Rubrimentiphilum sp.]|nr:YegS/Rv2252/BmrU family lipid kinase [Candidatus Rubrimentiphilum sp.]
MRALLVLNELARSGKRQAELVRRTLAECEIDCVDDPDAGNLDAVIAAGGDGTILHVLPLALERALPLGVIPLGTFNDLAHTLDLPFDIPQACAVIKALHTQTIDVARVNGVYYLNEASIGLSSRIARRQTPEAKQRLGSLAVLSATVRSLRDAVQMRVRIEYDGAVERFKTLQLTIANSGHFGGIIRSANAAIDDGWLDLYSVEAQNFLQAIAVAKKVIARDPVSGDGLRVRRSKAFSVNTGHRHRIAADGEPAGTTPALFEVVPGALKVLVPQR